MVYRGNIQCVHVQKQNFSCLLTSAPYQAAIYMLTFFLFLSFAQRVECVQPREPISGSIEHTGLEPASSETWSEPHEA